MHSHRMRVLDTPDRWNRWDRRHRTITRRLENRTGNTMPFALPQSVAMGPREKDKEEKDDHGGLQSGHYNHHTVKRGCERIRDVDRKWIRRSGLSLHHSTTGLPPPPLGDFHAGAMVGGAKPRRKKDGSLRYWGGPWGHNDYS